MAGQGLLQLWLSSRPPGHETMGGWKEEEWQTLERRQTHRCHYRQLEFGRFTKHFLIYSFQVVCSSLLLLL